MRKIFTFLFAALMSVGMFAATEVTITQADFPQHGTSFTKDGVTVSAGNIDGMGNINGPGSFSTTLGNFTQIEVTANNVSIVGPGWNGTSGKKTWTGNASSLSFNGGIMSMGMGVTLKFTIAEPTVAVTGVTLDQNEAQMTVGGETLTLTATVNPSNATDQSVSWSTSDANVATVENGVVTAVAAGNATITVTTTDGSFTATCAVTVSNPAPAGIGPREEFNLGTSSYAGEHYQVLGEFSGSSWIGVGGNDNKTITVESLNGEIIDNITLKVYFPSSWTGYSIASTSGTVSGDVANYQDLVVTNINATSVTLSRVGEGNANGSVSFHRIIVNEGGATAIEKTAVETKAIKRIVNGQLLIEKNGKIYNVMGAEVK